MSTGAEAPCPDEAPNRITYSPIAPGVQRNTAFATEPREEVTVAPFGRPAIGWIAIAVLGLELDALSSSTSALPGTTVKCVWSAFVGAAQTTEPVRACAVGSTSRTASAATTRPAANERGERKFRRERST